MILSISPQPDISFFGLRIQEPMTTLTDLLVAAVCFYAYWQLGKKRSSNKSVSYIKFYFLFMGMATFFGGLVGHGFQYIFGFEWKLLGWLFSLIAVMMIERSSIEYAVNFIPPKIYKIFLSLNILELMVFMFCTINFMNFKLVEFQALWGILFITFSFHLYIYLKTKKESSQLILLGIGTLLCALLVFDFQLSLSIWFNHSDLSHLFMAGGSYFFYLAALKLDSLPTKELVKA